MDKRVRVKKSGKKPIKSTEAVVPYSKSELEEKLCEIHNHIVVFEYDDALKISENVLLRNPNNCKALEMRASVATEMCDLKLALHFLNKAIAAEPFSGYSKYLSKAQLLTGKDSLECYKKAIEILKVSLNRTSTKKTISNPSNNEECMDIEPCSSENTKEESSETAEDVEEESSLLTFLSSVYCSIAELYLTDLCDEQDAEDQCVEATKKALETDSTNAEAHITKARYEIIVGDHDAAEVTLTASRNLWLPATDAEEKLSSSTRVLAAKALIELEMYEDADTLLTVVVEQDDQVVETYYLLGWNSYLQGVQYYQQAREYLREAKQTELSTPCEDEHLLEHVDELLEAIEEAGVEEDDDDEDYEDIDDEEIEREILAQAGDQ